MFVDRRVCRQLPPKPQRLDRRSALSGFGRLAQDATWYHARPRSRSTRPRPCRDRAGELPRNGAFPTSLIFRTICSRCSASAIRSGAEPATPLPAACPDHADTSVLPSRIGGLLHDVGIDFLYSVRTGSMIGAPSVSVKVGTPLSATQELEGLHFVRGIQPTDPQTSLYFLHVLQPHAPWALLPLRQPLQRRLGVLWDCRRMAARR